MVAAVGIAMSAAALAPIVIGGVFALARLQARAVDAVFAIIKVITGVEYDGGSDGLRLLTGGLFGAAVFAVAYVALLVGTHIVTIIIVTLIGVGFSLALSIVSSFKSEEPSDLLGRLRFWDEEE